MNSHTNKEKFYRAVLEKLTANQMPFLVGGTYAFRKYTAINRPALDFDLFCKPEDCERILELMESYGYRIEKKFPWWLAKIEYKDWYTDIIYNHGNGMCAVDDLWFENAVEDEVFGVPVKLMPAEEIIWTKAFIQTRERYDGADIYHILLRYGNKLRWEHLYNRMEDNWQILFAHLINFTYIYPSERDIIPMWLMEELLFKFEHQLVTPPPREKICNGAYLSIGTDYSDSQYLPDLKEWGFKDPRPKKERPLNVQATHQIS